LYGSLKEILFESKVVGTDDTGVKVLDEKLPFARTGRIWPYCGDAAHPVIVYDYTTTRGRAGPEAFLKGYRGYLQADAYQPVVVVTIFGTAGRGQRSARSEALQRVAGAGLKVRVLLESRLLASGCLWRI